jgi:hypothetical protein
MKKKIMNGNGKVAKRIGVSGCACGNLVGISCPGFNCGAYREMCGPFVRSNLCFISFFLFEDFSQKPGLSVLCVVWFGYAFDKLGLGYIYG